MSRLCVRFSHWCARWQQGCRAVGEKAHYRCVYRDWLQFLHTHTANEREFLVISTCVRFRPIAAKKFGWYCPLFIHLENHSSGPVSLRMRFVYIMNMFGSYKWLERMTYRNSCTLTVPIEINNRRILEKSVYIYVFVVFNGHICFRKRQIDALFDISFLDCVAMGTESNYCSQQSLVQLVSYIRSCIQCQ